MDDEQLTRQRAMDAAAAVAVAAAAAAHQNQEAAAVQRQQQQHARQDGLDDQQQALQEKEGQGINDYGQPPAPAPVQDAGLETEEKREDEESMQNTSIQYAGSDIKEQNGDASQMDVSQSASNRPPVHHTKRRKINTCLPCKRRKVKCDRERPYCDQCKKHNFPPSECTWSIAVLDQPAQRGASTSAPQFTSSAAPAEAAMANSSSGSQWYEMSGAPWASFNALPVDQNSQSLMGRIAELEAALETVKSEQLTGDAPREDDTHWESKGAGLSEAERGMAADALAMIAQHQPSADPAASSLFPINTYHSYKAKRLLPFGSNPSPPEVLLFRGKASNVRVREVLALLPDEAIIHRLLLALDHIQAVGLDMGINTRLIQVQLDAFTSAVTNSKGEEVPGLDLSFAALLFHVLTTSLEFQSVDTVLLEMDLTDDGSAYSYMTEGQRRDAVHEVTDLWYSAGQTLLAIVEHESNPNLNTLMALSLKHHYLAAHGKSIGAQCTLASALSLSQAVGLDELHTNSDSQRRPSQRGATSKAPLANLAVLFPLYRSKEESKGETESNAFWFPSQSALIEESGRRLYCHFLAQTCLEQSHPSTLSSMVFAAHSGPTDGLERGDAGAGLTWTLSRVAAAVQETQMAGPGSKPLEDALSQIVLPVGVDKEDDRFACQSAVAQLYMQYQLMVSYRSSESANAHNITAARNILRHRRWLADQSDQGPLFTKAFALQRFTLEAALTLALYLLKEGQHDGSEVVLAEVTGAVDCLTIGPREERSYGQRLVDLLIHHNMRGKAKEEVEAEQPDTLALVAQHLGFHTNHPIIDYLAGAVAGRRPTADAAVSFWKAIGKQSGVLLASP